MADVKELLELADSLQRHVESYKSLSRHRHQCLEAVQALREYAADKPVLDALMEDIPDLSTMNWPPMYYALRLEWLNWMNKAQSAIEVRAKNENT